jgi:hypothetical protein
MVRVNKVHVHATGKRGEVETVAATYVEVEQLASREGLSADAH